MTGIENRVASRMVSERCSLAFWVHKQPDGKIESGETITKLAVNLEHNVMPLDSQVQRIGSLENMKSRTIQICELEASMKVAELSPVEWDRSNLQQVFGVGVVSENFVETELDYWLRWR